MLPRMEDGSGDREYDRREDRPVEEAAVEFVEDIPARAGRFLIWEVAPILLIGIGALLSGVGLAWIGAPLAVVGGFWIITKWWF